MTISNEARDYIIKNVDTMSFSQIGDKLFEMYGLDITNDKLSLYCKQEGIKKTTVRTGKSIDPTRCSRTTSAKPYTWNNDTKYQFYESRSSLVKIKI